MTFHNVSVLVLPHYCHSVATQDACDFWNGYSKKRLHLETAEENKSLRLLALLVSDICYAFIIFFLNSIAVFHGLQYVYIPFEMEILLLKWLQLVFTYICFVTLKTRSPFWGKELSYGL